ncbi:hypothetical protein GCM10008015_20460 [Flavobacterium palustre]|uniref:DUF7507 domain-containing protein n=1 Tax=Flavobacterium palustre TaxID=1476463 RepID=A0ABQ1HIL9_9FLAO|nr:gliding motility-associated C-terminal domain-containing protein [Flavobacterium palustre]GGA79665.1 hypothetical protein GCM10008015_20460 [Flavobacterium palustre]
MRNNYLDLFNKNTIKTGLFESICNQLLLFTALFIVSFNSYGQCNAVTPTPFVLANFDDLSVSTNTSGVCTSLLGCGIFNESRLINASLTDFATASFGVLSVGTNHSLRVTDGNSTYAAGTFAGFKIAPGGGLLSLDLLNGIRIRTYNDGVLTETMTGASLLGLTLLSSPTDYIVGFNTSATFDAIEIVLDGGVSLLSSTDIYHAVIREYCAGPALDCNTITKLSLPTHPVAISQANTGMSGVSVGSVADVENAISSSDTDYATINLTVGLLASGSIAVKEMITDYPAGTYAGIEIENSNLLSIAALGNVVVSTYLDGVLREQFSGTNLVANASLLASGGRFKLGFVANQSFDEVKLSVNQTIGLNLGTTRVYGAVFQRFCAGPELPCNMQTALNTPTYPVYINNVNSGINGLVCALCTVTNQDNLTDSDLSNYASVNLSVGVGTTGSLSVKDQITNYPVGTFTGYTIENPALLNVDALGAVRVTTYLDGVQQETKSGNGPLVAVGTDLLVGTGKQTIGFVATMPFDEVQITFQNLVAVNLGEVRVYSAVFQRLCDPVVACNQNYLWTNPAFPVTINGDNTGIDGVACVACAVNDTDNLLTADETDFANITLIAGVVGSGSVAVKDHLFTYPKGTFAGFVIRDLGTLAQVNLLQSMIISTYNNGVLQEARSAGQLADLSLLGIDVLGSTPGVYNVGFKTNLPFDEIKLTLNSVASVINSIDVYGAFVNTSESDDEGSGNLSCNSSSISVTKDGTYVDANNDGIVNAGDRVDYTFTITNTGNKTLTNVTITDNNASVTGSPIATLAPGANDTTSYTATYTITQADIDAGVVYNLATVTAQTILGITITATSTDPTPCATCPVNPTCTDCTATPIVQTNSIALVKTAVVSGAGAIGDVITYTFAVTNTGNTTLTNVTVTDPMTGLVISGSPIASLAPGVTDTTVKGIYIITQADVDAGKVTNSALVTAKDPQNNNVTDISGTTLGTDDNTETPVNQVSTIALVKTASVVGSGTVGDTINYTFAVTNTGTTTLTNVAVTDPMVGLIITGSPIASLAPGATNISITGTYVITQADVDAGKVTNSALVTAKDPQNNDVTDISGTTIATDDSTETPVGQRSTIALVKTASVGGTGILGDVITYTFAVTNTGTTTLTDIVVTDPMIGLTIPVNQIASLTPGVTDSTITGTYTITQADVDAGKVVNSALVTAKDPLSNDVTDISGTTIGTNDNTETPVTQTSSIALVKSASVGGTAVLGDVITYTFTVKNTGTTTLKNILVSDPMVGLIITGNPIASLAPGATTSITGTYTITQTDIDAGNVTNSALVTAKDPQNNNVTDISGTTETTNDATETPVTQNDAIALVKTAVVGGTGVLGDVITYTFRVTNTGNTTLTDIVVTDPMTGLVISGSPIASLAPGITNTSITGTYTITQADIDAGRVTNSALVTAKDPQNNNVTDTSGTAIDNNDATETPVTQNDAIALVKTAVVGGTGVLGDVITYTFRVTNTGNTTLTNVVVTDPMTGLVISGSPIASLAPGITNTSITGTYTITQADIDAGRVTNSALVTAKDPQNNNVTDTSGTAVDNNDATETPVTQNDAIALVKTAVVGGTGVLGDVITYTFRVTNTGNTTLTNVVVTDPMIGLTITGSPIASLAPGITNTSITGIYTITQADIDAGRVTNSALVTAKDPQNNNVTDISGTTETTNDTTETPLTQNDAIALVKTAVVGGTGVLGDVITYTFRVTNTGNTTLTNVVVTDPMTGLIISGSPIASLAPGITNTSITGTYTITQADIDAGRVTNSALVTAKDPQDNNVTDISGTTETTNDTTETPVTQNDAIALVKTAVVGGTGVLGDVITYTFRVTNTGNTTLTNVVVTDPMTGLVISGSPIASLAPGITNTSITGTYTITQADIDAGRVTNSALVTAKDPQNNDVTDISGTAVDNNDATETPVTQNDAIALVKTAVVGGTGVLGDVITYTFRVTNTGNTTLTNVVVTDPMVGLTIPVSTIATIAPGATNNTIVGTYVLKQADIDAGEITNSALVVAKDPEGNDVEDISGTTITNDNPTITEITANPSISVTKDGVYVDTNNDGLTNAGDQINYTFVVRNTGNTTLYDVIVTDEKVAIVGNAIPTLAYNTSNSTAFTATYTITQADIDAGLVYNLALVEATTPKETKVTNTSTDPIPCVSCPVNPDCPACTITPLAQSPKIALMLEGEFQDENLDGQAQIGETIKYTYTIMNMGNVPLSNVWIQDTKVGLDMNSGTISMPIGAMDNTTFTATYTLTQQDIIAGNVHNQATVFGTSPLGVVVQDLSDDDNPLEDDATVIGVEGCVVEVFNAVSPNVGSVYERILYIRGLDCYPDNTVQVFDRWGVKVFEVDGYNNADKAFRGISEGRTTVSQSKGLPNGTYFYVLKYVDVEGKGYDKSGYLHLIND